MELFAGENVKVAIVILNWNGKNFLSQFLPSLLEHSRIEDVKIIVADNGSTDDSVDFVKSNFTEIHLILFDKNYGFTGGYNKALEKIEAQYFILLNSDIEVSPNWINPIIKFMDLHTEIAACQPKIMSYIQKEYFEYAGAAGGFIDKFGYPFCRGRILKELEKDTGQYNDIKEVFWATGACMFVRADLFRKVGGFDLDFFAHMEEIDLCWRLKNMGYKIFYHSGSTVYHVGGGTLPNDNPNKLYLNYRNNLFLLYKNLPSNKRYRIVFFRMILDGISAFAYLFSFSFSYFCAVFRAHYRFYKSIRLLKMKRKQLSQTVNNYTHQEIYRKSIVFAFYIRKIKKFSELNFRWQSF